MARKEFRPIAKKTNVDNMDTFVYHLINEEQE